MRLFDEVVRATSSGETHIIYEEYKETVYEDNVHIHFDLFEDEEDEADTIGEGLQLIAEHDDEETEDTRLLNL